MAQAVGIRIDLRKLAIHLAIVKGQRVTVEDAVQWLAENDFERHEDYWIGDSISVALLDREEILDCWELGERGACNRVPNSAPGAALPAKDFEGRTGRCAGGRISRQGDEALVVIPEAMVGLRKRDVALRWRKIASRVVQDKTWGPAFAELEMIHVDDAPFPLVVGDGRGFLEGERVHLDVPFTALKEAIDKAYSDVDKAHLAMRQLTLQKIDEFWVCLCHVSETYTLFSRHVRIESGSGTLVVASASPSVLAEDRALAIVLMRRILRWWPRLCEFDGRYTDSAGNNRYWPLWGTPLQTMMQMLGWEELRKGLWDVDPDRAGQMLDAALREVKWPQVAEADTTIQPGGA